MTENYYHYQRDLTTGAIEAAIEAHRQRGQKPKSIRLNPVNDLQIVQVDGVKVEVTEKQKPVNTFGVVV